MIQSHAFRWSASFLLAGVLHLALWWLPVALPSIELPPKPLRVQIALPPPPPPLPPPPVRPPEPPKPKIRPKRKRRLRPRPPRPSPAPRPEPPKPEPLRPPPPAPAPLPNPVVASTSAAPALPSRPSPQAAAVRPSPPAPPAPEVDLSGYRTSLGRIIEEQKRYPAIAQRMGFEGQVILLLRLSPQGRILRSPTVLRSSGYSMLDEEAIRMVKAAPIPPLPSAFSKPWADFKIPILFALQE